MNYFINKENKLKIILSNIFKSKKFPFFILFFILVYIHKFLKMDNGDDFWFQQVTKDYSLLNYLHLRYIGWTGRMTSETIYYFIFRDSGNLWRLLNPLFIISTLWGISRIVCDKKDSKKNYIINWYICICWIFISKSIILDSAIWISGSIVYLWCITFALLAIIPFKDAVVGEYNKNLSSFLYIICSFLASMGEEQVSLVLLAFSTIINMHIYIKHKKIYKYLVVENIVNAIGTLILFIAPGNYVRNYKETINWFPNYNLLSKWEFAFNGIQWLMNTLLNTSGIIFLFILLTLSLSVYKKNNGFKNGFSIIIPFLGCILIISSMLFSINTLLPTEIAQHLKFPHMYYHIHNILNKLFFDFNTPNPFALKKLATIKFILWPVIILTVPYFILYLYDFKTKGVYVALIYIAGLCSAAVMFVSSTMYASGPRTFFVLAIMFFIVFISMIKESNLLFKKRYVIILGILTIFKYLYIFYF
ncbi:MAG: DUF6056 family protein [Clostridium sp.]|nr:DUF6056 family protein [Clostridium sp.]